MSTIIAIKKNGRIYMAADTQTTSGERKRFSQYENGFKIHRFDNGILLGCTGTVRNAQMLRVHPEFFPVPEDGEMTKRFVVENIIPEIFKCYVENELRNKSDDEPASMSEEYLLAYRDKLFRIGDVFDVSVLEHYAASGAGGDITLAGLAALDAEDVTDEETIERRLAELIKLSAYYITSVGGPCDLIDTVNLTHKLVD